MSEQSFPLPQAQFAAVKMRLEAAGQTVTLPRGVLTKGNVEIAYSYDGATVSCAIQKKPGLMPAALIWSK